MKTPNILYVASKSPSRQELLKEAGIPFCIIDQTADESVVSRDQALQSAVEEIARLKMAHALLPVGIEGQVAFVMTADTMGIDYTGRILGKPLSVEHAIETIRLYRHGAITGTAVCVERRRYSKGVWVIEEHKLSFASAVYTFDMPDAFIDEYVRNSVAYHGINCLEVSGGVAIEGYGAQFIRQLNGSYTAVMGLPMYELRVMLNELGFYEAAYGQAV